jgi:hypothetical protein
MASSRTATTILVLVGGVPERRASFGNEWDHVRRLRYVYGSRGSRTAPISQLRVTEAVASDRIGDQRPKRAVSLALYVLRGLYWRVISRMALSLSSLFSLSTDLCDISIFGYENTPPLAYPASPWHRYEPILRRCLKRSS